MDIQTELILSYYKELSPLSKDKNVYLVQHIETNTLYVRKILDVYNAGIYQQLKEANIPGIPSIYECIEDDNHLYIIEEYIHGRTLEAVFSEDGLISEELATDFILQLCSILNKIHSCNPPIIHRDIKPSNLILTSESTLKLIDFNAAKYYADGSSKDTTLLGTQNFAAPEQYGFSQSDVRTDIYGLGVTMNYLLTGKYPNEAISDGKLNKILSKCLKLTPDDRYSDCNELLRELNTNKEKFTGRIRPINTALLIFTLLLLIISAILFINHRKNDLQTDAYNSSLPSESNGEINGDNNMEVIPNKEPETDEIVSGENSSPADVAPNTDNGNSTGNNAPGATDRDDTMNNGSDKEADNGQNDFPSGSSSINSSSSESTGINSSSQKSSDKKSSSSQSNAGNTESEKLPAITPTPDSVRETSSDSAVTQDVQPSPNENSNAQEYPSSSLESEKNPLIPEVDTSDLISPVEYYIDGDYIYYSVPDFTY